MEEAIDRSIHQVGDFLVSSVVLYDGVLAKITGFKNRNTAFLKNIAPGDGEWSTAKASIKGLQRPIPMSIIEAGLKERGVTLATLVADSLTDGLRRRGVPAKAIVDETAKTETRINVLVMAERPPEYIKLTFYRGGE
jgi:hypothetical protein